VPFVITLITDIDTPRGGLVSLDQRPLLEIESDIEQFIHCNNAVSELITASNTGRVDFGSRNLNRAYLLRDRKSVV